MTHTTAIYKPTFMQTLLGKNYKWWYFILYYRNAQLTYNANSLFHSLSSIISFIILVLSWFFINGQNNNYHSFGNILTYFSIGYIFSGLTPMWISEMLGYKIYGGGLSTYLMAPTSIFRLGICEMIGRGVIVASLLIVTPYLLILPFIWSFLNHSFELINLICLISFVPLTFMIKYTLDFTMGCWSFWFINNGGFMRFYGSVIGALDGSRIPLNYLTVFIPFITFLPTSYFFYLPVNLSQNFSWNEYLKSYSVGIAWCLVLYFLAKWVFKMGLKRNEAVGL